MAKDVNRTVKVRQKEKGATLKHTIPGSSEFDEPYFWDEVITVKWGKKSKDFYVCLRTEGDDRTLSKQWGYALMQTAAKLLKKGKLYAFERNDLTDHLGKTYLKIASVPITLSKKNFEQLEKDREHADLAFRSFRYTVDRLKRLAYSPTDLVHSEALSLLGFLDRSASCSTLGTNPRWLGGKISSIRSYFSSFSNHKQRSSNKFATGRERAASDLMDFDTPRAWISKPVAYSEEFLREKEGPKP